MDPWKTALFSSSILFALLLLSTQVHGEGGEVKAVSKMGEGECFTDHDCSNNGLCELDPKEKGSCKCNVDFRGANCEDPAKNQIGGKVIAATSKNDQVEVAGLKGDKFVEKTGKTRNLDGNSAESGMKKDVLEFDKGSNVAGIDPTTLADAGQECMIYSPITKKFLFMSFDKVIFGKKHNVHVEVRGQRIAERNMFKIEKGKTAGKYYILNVKTKKYMYVSKSTTGILAWKSFNVLGEEGDPETKGASLSKYEFDFEGDDDGFYRIKNGDNFLFVAKDVAGVPSYNVIQADSKFRDLSQKQWFQFALKDAAKVSIVYRGDDKKVEVAPSITYMNKRFEVSDDKGADQVAKLKFTETFKTTTTFSKTKGFTITGSFTGGIPVVGTVKPGISVAYTNSEQTTEAKELTETMDEEYTITTKGGQISCVCIAMDKGDFTIPFDMVATTKDKKTIKATGQWTGSRHYNGQCKQEIIPWTKTAKCPFESA